MCTILCDFTNFFQVHAIFLKVKPKIGETWKCKTWKSYNLKKFCDLKNFCNLKKLKLEKVETWKSWNLKKCETWKNVKLEKVETWKSWNLKKLKFEKVET